MPDETIWNFVLKVYTCVYGTSHVYLYEYVRYAFMMRT